MRAGTRILVSSLLWTLSYAAPVDDNAGDAAASEAAAEAAAPVSLVSAPKTELTKAEKRREWKKKKAEERSKKAETADGEPEEPKIWTRKAPDHWSGPKKKHDTDAGVAVIKNSHGGHTKIVLQDAIKKVA